LEENCECRIQSRRRFPIYAPASRNVRHSGSSILASPRYDFALEALRDNVFDKWREYDAEDSVRFYALRLHDVGFIKSNPQKPMAESTDWRFFN
jgi:hypothetical protein